MDYYQGRMVRAAAAIAARAAQIRREMDGDRRPPAHMEPGDAAFQKADRAYVRRLLEAQLEMTRRVR